MKLVQRLGIMSDYSKLIDAIKRNKGSCDAVWIPTAYGYPSYETHREMAKKWKSVADLFRSEGISVSMQLSNTLGHGEYMSGLDCTGIDTCGPFEKMVGHDGKISDFSFCPRGKRFREYTKKSLSFYFDIKPDEIWIDDDLRPTNHKPVSFGCFCDGCIKKFNERENTSFTREELVQEILHGDIKYRERWIDFTREGLYDFVFEISDLVHKNLPNTVMCSQHGAYGAYEGGNHNYVFDAMYKATGFPPRTRPGGGAYNDFNPLEFITKMQLINFQNCNLPDYVVDKCPEIENLPFNVYGKTPAGTAYETTLYLANGNTDMSYSMIREKEPMTFYEKGLKLFSQMRPYWEELSRVSRETNSSGFRYFLPEKFFYKKIDSDCGMEKLNEENHRELEQFLRDGIPISYERIDTGITFLHPECAFSATKEELETLLNKPIITDIETLLIMKEKGIDLGFDIKEYEGISSTNVEEEFTDSKFAISGVKYYSPSFFSKGRTKTYAFSENHEDIEVISYYSVQNNAKAEELFSGEKHPYGVSSAIIKTPKNANWVVFGYCFWKGDIPSYRRDQILDIADKIGEKPLCARIITPMQAILLPRTDKKTKKTMSVTVFNPTMGDSEEAEMLVREPIGENFTFMSQYNGCGKIDFEKIKDGFKVKIPSIKAYSALTVFIK